MPFETLLIATHNQGKVLEFQHMFADMDLEIRSAADYDLPEPEETEKTFEGNALLKARAACNATGLPALADDSGLCVDALDGAPGIYSARWGETDKSHIDGRDFSGAMQRIFNEIKEKNGIGIDGTQTAYFTTVIALVYPDGREEIFEGIFEGSLCWPTRGPHKFGYDPIFVPNGYDITCAEMDEAEKNAISHRAKAVAQFKAYLSSRAQSRDLKKDSSMR